jgi:hypothetical protein
VHTDQLRGRIPLRDNGVLAVEFGARADLRVPELV